MTEDERKAQIHAVMGNELQGTIKVKNRDLSRYQVVRQEFITNPDEVQITFNRGRLYINSFGLRQFPEEDYIQVLVDEDTQSAVIKPSVKKKRDSFLWCGGLNKRKPRHVSCVPLCYLIFRMMNWDWNSRYRITGEIEDYGEERVIFLDLRSAVCFMRTETGDGNSGRAVIKMPQNWSDSFGMPYEDYSKRQDVKVFDDVAVFDVELLMKREKIDRMRELKEAAESKKTTIDADNTQIHEAGEGVDEESK